MMQNKCIMMLAASLLLLAGAARARSADMDAGQSLEKNEQFSVSYDLVNFDNNKNLNPALRQQLVFAKQRYPDATKMTRDFTKIGDTYKNVGDAYLDANGKVIHYHLKY